MSLTVPAVGSPAPDFTLDTTSGTPVTLSSFQGSKNVLVAFFPLAFTSTCTEEVCAFSEDYSEFEKAGVAVIPLSIDAVPSLREFKAKYNLGVELASDIRRDASRAFGTLNEKTFVARRSYFLVDKQGIIRWAHVEEKNGNRRENGELFAEIAKLQA